MIQVINNKVKKTKLPKTGKLKDGATVSGYHLLSESKLAQEGWLPLVDNQPDYDDEIEYLEFSGYDIQENQVAKIYDVRNIADRVDTTSEIERLRADLDYLLIMNGAQDELV